jgi:acid phosphatase
MSRVSVAISCAIACASITAPAAFAAAPNYNDIETVVVIYAENRSFDSLFGQYPGANGLTRATPAQYTQLDRDGTALSYLPPVVGGLGSGVTAGAPGTPTSYVTVAYPTQSQTGAYFAQNGINRPFNVQSLYNLSANTLYDPLTITNRDLYHRFYENQMQINGGANNMFAAWADSGGLTMMYLPNVTANHPLWALAQKNVLADNFFQGAYGGSYLNHQFLICGCAPTYPNDGAATPAPKNPVAGGKVPVPTVLGAPLNGVPQLATTAASPATALSGPPVFVNSSVITPFIDGGTGYGGGQFYSVNTSQPANLPSGNIAAGAADLTNAGTLPAQTAVTIGDLLDAKGVDWAYYAGGFCNQLALESATATDTGCSDPGSPSYVATGVTTNPANPDFQFHHQPFNFYAHLAPNAPAPYGLAYRSDHLRDAGVASSTQIIAGTLPSSQLTADIAAGHLPAVTFYKPNGPVNEHNGYANVTDGDKHIAAVVAALQNSPQYPHMLIVITYDEFGGIWDHVAPPKADAFGPGTRIPAIIISPYARKGYVDHTQYDTTSILRFIQNKWNLTQAGAPFNGGLAGISYRDAQLRANGYPAMGDLTNALVLP